MAVTSFDMDERTQKSIDDLKVVFGVKTNAAVLRKALALATIAARNADKDNTVVVAQSSSGQGERVSLAG